MAKGKITNTEYGEVAQAVPTEGFAFIGMTFPPGRDAALERRIGDGKRKDYEYRIWRGSSGG